MLVHLPAPIPEQPLQRIALFEGRGLLAQTYQYHPCLNLLAMISHDLFICKTCLAGFPEHFQDPSTETLIYRSQQEGEVLIRYQENALTLKMPYGQLLFTQSQNYITACYTQDNESPLLFPVGAAQKNHFEDKEFDYYCNLISNSFSTREQKLIFKEKLSAA